VDDLVGAFCEEALARVNWMRVARVLLRRFAPTAPPAWTSAVPSLN
jgi:hypothetical protein